MEIATTQQHRALAFVAACVGSGYRPTREEVTAWLASPSATEPKYWLPAFEGFSRTLGWVAGRVAGIEMTSPGESEVDHLVRIGWLQADRDRLAISRLGSAIYAAATRASVVESGPAIVVLGTDDPLAYPTLVGELADAGAGLLVDPYIRVEQLHTLIQHTHLTRVLVKRAGRSGLSADALTMLEVFLSSSSLSRPIEVRVSEDPKLHDRLIIREDGGVQTMGASMNTVEGGTGTVISPVPALAGAVLIDQAEAQWDAARPLAASPGLSEPSQPQNVGVNAATKRRRPSGRPKRPPGTSPKPPNQTPVAG